MSRPPYRLLRLSLLLPVLAAGLGLLASPPGAAAQGKGKTYLFCFWNVENLFDDRPDRREPPDRDFDDFFAKDKEALTIKLERLTEVLLGMNGGRGPDILALAEVESQRATELLMQALNKGIKDKEQHYTTAVWKDPGGLRNIATAVITRLKVKGPAQVLGSRQRMLRVVLDADGKDLVVVASHWTARVSDKTGDARPRYAETIHRDYAKAYAKDRKVDYLVCGDFNDDPTDRSVIEGLRATGDLKKVLDADREAIFYNPFAAKLAKKEGTHYFGPLSSRTAHVFDQIVVSPGLLDGEGWSYAGDATARITRKFEFRGGPDRFGGPDDRRPWKNRGASDHFPVSIELRVNK